MAEKEEMTQTRSTDQFAAHEPRMANFSPDFSPIDEPKPKPVRTGQRGRRGVDEWGNPTTDSDDEEFWANIRSDAEEGGFGAGGTVAARKAAPSPAPSPAPTPSPVERPAAEPLERPRSAEPLPERPARRSARRSAPRPAAASVDPDATTVQGPLPQRQPAPAPAGLADLVDPSPRPVPSQAELAEQRTVTFAAPTPDVMTILGAGAQPVPAPTRREPAPAPRPAAATTSGSFPAGSGSYGSGTGTPAAPGSGSFPATPTSGAFPATGPTTSGNFPVAGAPIHGAPTSDPFPAYGGTDALDTTAAYSPTPAATTSGSWPASPDIFDDAPAAPAAPAPAYTQPSSWPAFEQPTTRSSYEVSAGWAVADDAEPTTGPSPATGTPTAPNRAVSAYDDVLSAPTPPQSPFTAGAYETGDVTTTPGGGAAWPAPPASETSGNWPAYDPQQDTPGNERSRRRRAPEQDYPHDYYR